MLTKRLKALRNKLKLNQKDFANFLELNRSTYAHYELNKRQLPVKLLIKISTATKCNIDWLLTGKGDMFVAEIEIAKDKSKMKKAIRIIESSLNLVRELTVVSDEDLRRDSRIYMVDATKFIKENKE